VSLSIRRRSTARSWVQRLISLATIVMLAGCEIGIDEPAQTQTSRSEGPADIAPATPSSIARGRLQFVEGYRAGYSQAIAQSKPMLIFFTASWCHFCHQMANEAFVHPQVVSLSEQFQCILVDADAEADICRQFGVTAYPTIQFVSPRGALVGRVVGKQPGHRVMMAMQAALQSIARNDDPPAR
jgi:thioredoxin-like negative regulator of GroEL